MRLKFALAVMSGLFVMGSVATAFGQGAVPPSGDIRTLEPPIDQRKKQGLKPMPPTVPAPVQKPGVVSAPDIANKGTTDAR